MHTLDIPERCNRFNEYFDIKTDNEFDSLLVCNIVKILITCLGGDKFLGSLDGSRIYGSIGIHSFLKELVNVDSRLAVLLDFVWRKVKLDCPMYNKQTNLQGLHYWNKMWSLSYIFFSIDVNYTLNRKYSKYSFLFDIYLTK